MQERFGGLRAVGPDGRASLTTPRSGNTQHPSRLAEEVVKQSTERRKTRPLPLAKYTKRRKVVLCDSLSSDARSSGAGHPDLFPNPPRKICRIETSPSASRAVIGNQRKVIILESPPGASHRKIIEQSSKAKSLPSLEDPVTSGAQSPTSRGNQSFSVKPLTDDSRKDKHSPILGASRPTLLVIPKSKTHSFPVTSTPKPNLQQILKEFQVPRPISPLPLSPRSFSKASQTEEPLRFEKSRESNTTATQTKEPERQLTEVSRRSVAVQTKTRGRNQRNKKRGNYNQNKINKENICFNCQKCLKCGKC